MELQLSQVRSNLIGYWVARVSLVRSRPKSGEQEYSLAQILSPEKDRFVYRGVGRAKDSQDIDFCWHAREAWVQPVDQRYRFVFHTDNRDILLGPDDTANIGFIDYDTSAGLRLGQGTFFDYSLSRARVTRKKMLLYRYDQLDDSEKTFFHDFFQNYPVLAYRVRMEQILRKVERDFSP
jgi:hypothetical protein